MKMPKVGVVAWVSPTIFPFYCAFSKIHRLKPVTLVFIYYHTKDVYKSQIQWADSYCPEKDNSTRKNVIWVQNNQLGNGQLTYVQKVEQRSIVTDWIRAVSLQKN